MNQQNKISADKHLRRTFIKKLLSAISAAVFLPGLTKLFASVNTWQNVSSSGESSVLGGTEPFLGEIMMVGFNFAPMNWSFCNGQTLNIMSNTALFSLLGTTYGGNGQTTFALPNLQGRFPMGYGQGLGLSYRALGESGGAENVTLLPSKMPAHTHTLRCSNSTGTSPNPANNYFARDPLGTAHYGTANNSMNSLCLSNSGSGSPHNNLHPYLVCTFVIAIAGVFPPRA